MSTRDTHEGEPCNWSKADLLAWLDNDDKWVGVARSKLVEEVARQLDKMYQDFVPTYPNMQPVIDLNVLMPWVPWLRSGMQRDIEASKDFAALKRATQDLMQDQGPLKVCFNASFAPGEILENLGRWLPLGRHPLDDFRHNQAIIARSIDSGEEGGIILQDYDQQEAMAMKVLGVRFLPPGGKLHGGYKVVCHNLHGHRLQALNGLMATVVATAVGMCTVELDGEGEAASGGSGEPKRQEEVPSWALLFVKGTMIMEGVGSVSRQAFAADVIANREWQSWQPVVGDCVVLRGLKARPDLNGRFGQVAAVGQAAGRGQEAVRHSVKLVKTAGPGTEEVLVSVKRGNMTPVEAPPPVVVVAYAVHVKSKITGPRLMRFMDSQLPLLGPVRAIHCTPREIRCWNRCVDADSRFLAPVPAALKRKLLGQLDPAHWKLGVVMPVKRARQAPAIKKAVQELKAAITCRHCGKRAGETQKLLWCSRCQGVQYCSVDCQRADWKARHKQECGAPVADGTGAGPAQGAGPSGTQAGQADTDSVLVPVAAALPMGAKHTLDMRSGKTTSAHQQHLNVHGDELLLVKVQNAMLPDAAAAAALDPDNPRWYRTPLMVYDKLHTVTFHVHPEGSTVEAHARLAELLRTRGLRGKLCPAGRKLYFRARREAANMRIFLRDLPPQQQSW